MSKTLLLTPFYPPNIGGAETFAEGLVKEISKWHDVYVLTYMPFQCTADYYQMMKSGKFSIEVRRLKWLIKPWKVWKGVSLKNWFLVFPKMALCSFFLISKINFKTVHSLGLLSGLMGAFIRKVTRSKHIMTLLALYDFSHWSGIRKNIARFIVNNCDVVFVEGENGEKDLRGLGDIKTKIKRFNHWVDQEVFKLLSTTKKKKKIRILFVGRPIKEKGFNVVKEAENILNNKEKYEFVYIENTPHEELPKHYQMADIVVVPSLYAEGFSRVVAEAASCGCIVITSNRGSLPEMVRDFGIIFDGTGKNLAERINEICEEDKFSKLYSLSYKTFEYAVENFNSKNGEVFINAYKQQTT